MSQRNGTEAVSIGSAATAKPATSAALLFEAEERQRQRIAAQLHDQVGQTLLLARLKLQVLLRQGSTVPPSALEEIQRLIDDALGETRLTMLELCPPVLRDRGLEAAVRWLVQNAAHNYHLEADVECEGDCSSANDDVALCLYHALRELLLNVAKHAHARHVRVVLKGSDHRIRIEVRDDGVGFDVASAAQRCGDGGGFGLFSLRQRLIAFGGQLQIESRIGEGTRAILIVSRQELLTGGGSHEHSRCVGG